MKSSQSLTSDTTAASPVASWRFLRNVVIKGLVLFCLANLLFAAWYPLDELGKITAYNSLFPGRQRLPYGDHPERAYNLSLYNLNAMFASHELSARAKPANEYRVILLGDSATWGFLLPVEHTLSAYLNQEALTTASGKQMRFYNLGYPVMSLTKDLLLLSYAMRYKPDLIIWLVTLESFPIDKQLYPPLVQNNPAQARQLIRTYQLNLDVNDPSFQETAFWQRTLIGARRPLADLIRLQLYGVLWAATGVDQDIPRNYTPRMEDLPPDLNFHEFKPPTLPASQLAFDVLGAGIRLAGDVPILLVNEPMFISQGKNSDLRYNFYYPRWAYDDYRIMMTDASARRGWRYLDAWDIIPGSEFTNSAVHLSAAGNQQFAEYLTPNIQQIVHSLEAQ